MPSIDPVPDGVRLRLDGPEAEVLRNLTHDMQVLLRSGVDRSDPALGRIFPEAHPDDRAAQRSYDELTGDSLRTQKLEAFEAVSRALGDDGSADATLSEEDAERWLAALTDMRLVIGERIGVDEERMSADLDPSDPDAQALALMHFLGWIQDLVLQAMGA